MTDDVTEASSPAVATAPLTVDELIRLELAGKDRALARYDAVLWRIRTGYVVVLAGMLTVLLGDKKALPMEYKTLALIGLLFVVVSILAFVVDAQYVERQFRLIAALDNLLAEALKRAVGPANVSVDVDRLRSLLCIAAEREELPNLPAFRRALLPLLGLYSVAPICIYLTVAWLYFLGH